jgi:Family of unknown function (DUF6188)
MGKKLVRRGRDTLLPVVGDTLTEISLSATSGPVLVFRAADGGESEVRIEDRITLTRGGSEQVLDGAKPGPTFDPRKLSPLLAILGEPVADAIGTTDGELRLTFANEWVLGVASTTGYEAWHFQYPRPGRPVGSKLNRIVAVTGTRRHLL